MEVIMRCLALSWMLGLSCKVFFDTMAEKREWKYRWAEYAVLPVFMTGFIIIAFTEIPPYILQPVRTIAAIFIAAQIFYKIRVPQNFMLSTFFCAFIWFVSMLVQSIIYMLPQRYIIQLTGMEEFMWNGFLLCLVLLFHVIYKGKEGAHALAGTDWLRFSCFPLFSIVIVMALSMTDWSGELADGRIRSVIIVGFGIINVFALYFISSILTGEAKVQKLRLSQERVQSQMDMYRSMQESYERQRRYMHDYKNQLDCIQGLIAEGKIQETLEYVQQLTGSVRQNMDYVNTNHPVVNVVLNQKYKYALDKNITMAMQINDLSGLTMSEEDIVTLLVNLLDNAVEACEKLPGKKIIKFKMTLEDRQLILSVSNPVIEPVKIREKLISSTKKDTSGHGFGMLNVNAVVEKNNGTSVVKCEAGEFRYFAMIPV